MAAISGIPGAEEESSSFSGEAEARALFDRYILQSLPGKMIVHAARRGEAAIETSSLGGIFTYYLLESATYIRTITDYMPVGILELTGNVRQNLREDGYEQTPVLAYAEGNVSVPFMISIPQIITGGIEQRKYKMPVRNKGRLLPVSANQYPLRKNERVLLGVLFAAGIYHLLKNAS